MEIPQKQEDNYIAFKRPVHQNILQRAKQKLGEPIPDKVKLDGKEFRKWLAKRLCGKVDLAGEKAAAEFLESIGVEFIEWPYSWTTHANGSNRAVLNDKKVKIIQIDEVQLDSKWQLVEYPAQECAPFCKVDAEWGVFGNFGRTPLVVGGVEFKTSEQLFQLMKFRSREAVEAVYAAGNPKMTAKKWEKICRRADWGSMIVDAMKFVLVTKYAQSETFRNELLRSKGKFIVEDQTTFKKKNPDTWGAKLIGDKYIGPNLLGRLLMELRDTGTLEYTLPDDALKFLEFLK